MFVLFILLFVSLLCCFFCFGLVWLDPEGVLFILLFFSLLCSCFVWVVMLFDLDGWLFDPDGWFFFVFFLYLMIFFVFLYCLIRCFSAGCVLLLFFYGDPEGACLIQMGRG